MNVNLPESYLFTFSSTIVCLGYFLLCLYPHGALLFLRGHEICRLIDACYLINVTDAYTERTMYTVFSRRRAIDQDELNKCNPNI